MATVNVTEKSFGEAVKQGIVLLDFRARPARGEVA